MLTKKHLDIFSDIHCFGDVFIVNELKYIISEKDSQVKLKTMAIDKLLSIFFSNYSISLRNTIIKILKRTKKIDISKFTEKICFDILSHNTKISFTTIKLLKEIHYVSIDINIILSVKKQSTKAFISLLRKNPSDASTVYHYYIKRTNFFGANERLHMGTTSTSFYIQNYITRHMQQENISTLTKVSKKSFIK